MLSGGATLTRCRQRRCALAINALRLLVENPMGTFPKNATRESAGAVCSLAAKPDRHLKDGRAASTVDPREPQWSLAQRAPCHLRRADSGLVLKKYQMERPFERGERRRYRA